MTYYEDELQFVDKGPGDGIAILFVLFVGGPAFDEGIADEGVEGGRRGRSEALGVWGERTGPEDDAALVGDGAEIKHGAWESVRGRPAWRPSRWSRGSRRESGAGTAA